MNYSAPFGGRTVASAPPDVRAAFIRKVYHLFFVSLLVTVGTGYVAALPGIRPAMIALLPVLIIGELVCGLILAFVRRTTGINVALLYVFSALQGAVLGPVLTLMERVAPGVPAEAAILTVAVFGGLSLYVLQTGRDFSYLGGMLTAGIIAMVVAGIVMFFVHSSLVHTLYCVIGILIFSGYVLYDTSMIMHRLGPDEAVAGAISIYLDLINLFWLILNLLMELNRKD
ncbi:MAG: Bax inhibitor-1 family protein [Chthonomonadales bacterium]